MEPLRQRGAQGEERAAEKRTQTCPTEVMFALLERLFDPVSY